MTQKDQNKILDVGFMIIRPDYFRLLIKYKSTYSRDWKTAEKGFKTKSAVEKRMKELLEDQYTIED